MKSKEFTLIELLIVVAIASILLAILLQAIFHKSHADSKVIPAPIIERIK